MLWHLLLMLQLKAFLLWTRLLMMDGVVPELVYTFLPQVCYADMWLYSYCQALVYSYYTPFDFCSNLYPLLKLVHVCSHQNAQLLIDR